MLTNKYPNILCMPFSRSSGVFSCLSSQKFKYFCAKNEITTHSQPHSPDFGIAFDIDGVLMRGPKTIPAALSAIDSLHERNGKWKVPVIFLTNASNASKYAKAAELSKFLHKRVLPSQVVTPHSALQFFSSYFDKHVVVCGHGPLKSLAQNIGFKRCSTIDDISRVFPWLDACKPRNELYSGGVTLNNFPKIEAIVLLGEPERWEHSLQILLDILIQNGDLDKTPNEYLAERSLPQLPVFVCGSDLVWSSNAPSPRLALGSFLNCLEALYERLTGRRLICTGLFGKPNPSAYMFAMAQVNAIAAMDFGTTKPLKRIYCIGDNPEVDIYGANIFNLCLQTIPGDAWDSVFHHVNSLVQDDHPSLFPNPVSSFSLHADESSNIPAEEIDWRSLIHGSGSTPQILRQLTKQAPKREPVCTFEPVLVTSGVYHESDGEPHNWRGLYSVHKKYPDLEFLYRPYFVSSNVAEAVNTILQMESSHGNVDASVPESCSLTN